MPSGGAGILRVWAVTNLDFTTNLNFRHSIIDTRHPQIVNQAPQRLCVGQAPVDRFRAL
jgi:hypothetical protein